MKTFRKMQTPHQAKDFLTITVVTLIGTLWFSAAFAQEPKTPLWAHVPDTISPEWGKILSEAGKSREQAFPAPDDIEGWKKMQVAAAKPDEAKADETAKAFNISYAETTIGGVPVVIVTPKALKQDDKIAVYTHGGAYVLQSAISLMEEMALFSTATGLKVYAIDYTLAPHSKWQSTTEEVVSVFKALLEKGYRMDEIVLCGDSAGGGLAAGTTLKMRDLDMGMPAALVLWSPWADISENGDTYVTLRDAEPYYTYEHLLGPAALAYADAKDHKHPYVSPVYGDYSKGFPPTLIQGGTKEIFLSNFIRLYQALDQAGQKVKLDIYEGMPHVFLTALPETPESQVAWKKVKDWVTKHLIQD